MKANRPLYFAYGLDMDMTCMLQRCPTAALLGRAMLRGYRFVIQENGCAAVMPDKMGTVFGVLWQIAPEEWEPLKSAQSPQGLPLAATVTIRNAAGQMVEASMITANEPTTGRPTEEYLNAIVKAGRVFHFPEAYCQQLEQWLKP